MQREDIIREFLAAKRFRALFSAWKQESGKTLKQNVSIIRLLLIIFVAALPTFAILFESQKYDVVTILVGIASIVAVVFRLKMGLRVLAVENWKRSIRLTHTAFAIGCIPFAISLALFPERC